MSADHARRIHGQLLAEIDVREMDEMKQKAEPLIMVVALCLVAVLMNELMQAYAKHEYAGEIRTAAIFAAALNGQQIDLGNEAIATCKVERFNLVAGLKEP